MPSSTTCLWPRGGLFDHRHINALNCNGSNFFNKENHSVVMAIHLHRQHASRFERELCTLEQELWCDPGDPSASSGSCQSHAHHRIERKFAILGTVGKNHTLLAMLQRQKISAPVRLGKNIERTLTNTASKRRKQDGRSRLTSGTVGASGNEDVLTSQNLKADRQQHNTTTRRTTQSCSLALEDPSFPTVDDLPVMNRQRLRRPRRS